MNNDDKPRRRIAMPPKHETPDLEVTVIPSVEALFNDALAIIGSELSQYRSKTKRGLTLDLKEAKAVQGYMDTLVRLNKENREAAKQLELHDLSDEELKQLVSDYLVDDAGKVES